MGQAGRCALCPRCVRVAWTRPYCRRCNLVLLPQPPKALLSRIKPDKAHLDGRLDAALLGALIGNETTALADLERTCDALPAHARTRLALALVSDLCGNVVAALRHTSAALRLDPLRYAPPRSVGERLAAAATRERCRQLEANAAAGTPFELGRCRAMTGDLAGALDAYTEALRLSPGDPELLTAIGVALRVLGRVEEAIELHERARITDPQYALVYNNLAGAYAELGHLDEAAAAAAQAIAIDPRLGHAFVSLGMGHLEADEPAEAIAAALEAETRAPELTPAAAAVRGAAHLLGEEFDKARHEAIRGLQHTLAHRAPQLGFILGAALDRFERADDAGDARWQLWALFELDAVYGRANP